MARKTLQHHLERVEGGYVEKELRKDNVYPETQLISLQEATGFKARSGLRQAVVSAGEIVNIVSDDYGHMPNELFFGEVERRLLDAGIGYDTRSINHDNRAFAVDYILNDDRFHIDVKAGGSGDNIKPMMRFVTAYDGSALTSGHFGFFRKICNNGLHVAQAEIGFKLKRTGAIQSLVLPHIENLVKTFIDNKYYSLHRKFEVLAERPIADVKKFTQDICTISGLFNFGKSEKNPNTPGQNAAYVMETIDREAKALHTNPNLWIGYNAFNAWIHASYNDDFEKQKEADEKTFNLIYGMKEVLN